MSLIIFIISVIVLFTAGLWPAVATYVVLWFLTTVFWNKVRVTRHEPGHPEYRGDQEP